MKTPSQRQAAATVAAACEQHARTMGILADDVGLADAHPVLAAFADPRYNPAADDPVPPLDPHLAWCARHTGTTYYLADLYQALSVEAVKQRAFCQTPDFVTRLMLTCTWANAVDELAREPYPITPTPLPLRAIDPACGGGHILVELLTESLVASQMRGREERVRDAFGVVHGVDLDPFAVMIARFRFLVIACEWLRCRLDEVPHDIPVNIAAGDSLLYREQDVPEDGGLFAVDVLPAELTTPPPGSPRSDLHLHPGILAAGRYDVVVANPPYVTPKDAVSRDAIRAAYREVCHGKYSLAVAFEPLFHRLAKPGGWVARLTANSFMKREFGRPLVESYFPTIDMQWIIDTSGAYIPGHGTPTVILVSRNRPPSDGTVRTVLGIRGEPSKPERAADGLVWRSIEAAVYPYERGRRAAAAMWREDALCALPHDNREGLAS